MKGFMIQMMTDADACAYYGGYNNYSVKTAVVTAETPEQAVEKAEWLFPGMEINKYFVEETEIPEGYTEQVTMADTL